MNDEKIYCTSYCNQGHRLSDGKPVNHKCYILNPSALEAERDGDYETAQQKMFPNGRRIIHRGIKR